MIRHSVGVPLRKNLFIDYDDGRSKDILQDGGVSCAYFVSNILKSFNLTPATFANVLSLEKALLEYGWSEIDKNTKPENIPLGSLLFWSSKAGSDKKDIYGNTRKTHHHVGFYIGDNQAISNISVGFDEEAQVIGTPQQHHYTYHDQRALDHVLVFPFTMTMTQHFAQSKPTMLINKQLEIPFIGQTPERLHKAEQGLNKEEIARGLGIEDNLKYGRLCGLACILMANNYLSDYKKSLKDCIDFRHQTHSGEQLYRSQQAGRYHGGLTTIAKNRGISGHISHLEYDDIIGFKSVLADCVDNHKVLICSVSPGFNPNKRGGHLVILKGYNRNSYQEELIINDPLDPKASEGFSGAPINVSLEHFMNCWSGKYMIMEK